MSTTDHPAPRFPSPGQLQAHCKPVADAIKAGTFQGLDQTFRSAMADLVFPAGVVGEVNRQLAGTAYKIEVVSDSEIDEHTTVTTIHVTNNGTQCAQFEIRWTHPPFHK